MSTHNIFFVEKSEKILCGYPSYLELCRITKKKKKKKKDLGLTKADFNSGVVLFSSGLNSGILLYVI